MPYKQTWIAADMFMRHNDVGVYHTYKNDEIENGANTYWFVTDPYATIDDAFDVRELIGGDTINQHYGLADTETIKAVLTASIEMGILTTDGIKETESKV
jgi:hypothetical protein